MRLILFLVVFGLFWLLPDAVAHDMAMLSVGALVGRRIGRSER